MLRITLVGDEEDLTRIREIRTGSVWCSDDKARFQTWGIIEGYFGEN